MKNENSNLKVWNEVSETNPNFTKKVEYGTRSFTTINATYQLEQATRLWGSYGHKWGIKSLDLDFKPLDKEQILAIGRAVFYYPVEDKEASFPISSSIFVQEYNNRYKSVMIDDEFAKKLETDITTKALSKLGFAADVFFGKYDDNKYLNDLKEKYKKETPPPPPPPKKESKQAMKASQKAIDTLVVYAKDGEFERVEKNLHYYDETNIIITKKDRAMIEDIVKALKE